MKYYRKKAFTNQSFCHPSRTIIALGHLVLSCDQTLYVKLINILMEELENSHGHNQHSTPSETASNIRTYIQVRKSNINWS